MFQAFFTCRVPRRGSNQQCDDDAPVQGNNGSLSKDPAEGRELTSTPALIALQQISFDAPLALELFLVSAVGRVCWEWADQGKFLWSGIECSLCR